jgi:hypothetical protein
VVLRAFTLDPVQCGTYRRPSRWVPDTQSTFVFCEPRAGEYEVETELGPGVELRGLGGEAWLPMGDHFLAIREEGSVRELVRVIRRDLRGQHVHFDQFDIRPHELHAKTVNGRQYPRVLFMGGGEIWAVHVDEGGQEVIGLLSFDSFEPLPYTVKGAQRIDGIFPSAELVILRVVMGQICNEAGCVEDVRMVRLHR